MGRKQKEEHFFVISVPVPSCDSCLPERKQRRLLRRLYHNFLLHFSNIHNNWMKFEKLFNTPLLVESPEVTTTSQPFYMQREILNKLLVLAERSSTEISKNIDHSLRFDF